MLDVMAAAREQASIPGAIQRVRQVATDAQAEIDATIRSTLGDTGFAQ